MKSIAILIVALATLTIDAIAQRPQQRAQPMQVQGSAANNRGAQGEDGPQKSFIKNDVRAWRMVDAYTLADTIKVDTLLTGHQINLPIWQRNVSNVTLGNYGSPSQSTFFPTIKRVEGFTFFNSIADYMEEAEDYVYYNTKTPYANLTYQTSYPSRRSEEYVHILFTQNVNKRLNVGFKFNLSSAIGRYEAQRTDHSNFRLFGSFDGEYYSNNFAIVYHNANIDENGGLAEDSSFIHPQDDKSLKAEDFVVNMTDANNYLSRYQLMYNHSYNFATTMRMMEDSTEVEVPIASAHHTLKLETAHREFTVDKLANYRKNLADLFHDNKTRIDSLYTCDETRYKQISNVFQLKMSEEFNQALRFGLRLYLGNNIRLYSWPDKPVRYTDTISYTYKYIRQLQDETRVTSYAGGQIFKNIGKNLRWNAGAQIYFQGYNAGDFKIDGSIQTMFPLFGRQAELYANGYIELRSAEIFEEKYYSNHFDWGITDPNREKTLYASAGIKWDDCTELMGYTATINNRFYFDEQIEAQQSNGVVQVMGLYAFQHFRGLGFHSINRAAVQFTSDDRVVALPSFAITSSNFYENRFFGVLTLQLGADVRYNTKFYAPAYQPALMQFHTQREREVGDYAFIDPFLNVHIKRVRFYLKYEHINDGWGRARDYFHTIGYPANPGHVRMGISWNFYD